MATTKILEIPGYDILAYKVYTRPGFGIECRFTVRNQKEKDAKKHINDLCLLDLINEDPTEKVKERLKKVDTKNYNAPEA